MSHTKTNQIKKSVSLKSVIKSFFNKLGVLFLILISTLPFWLIYIFSDLFYLAVKYILKYRNQVILENLKYAFPDKTHKDILMIRNKYYRIMCDLTVESVKLYSMTENQLKKD